MLMAAPVLHANLDLAFSRSVVFKLAYEQSEGFVSNGDFSPTTIRFAYPLLRRKLAISEAR